MRFDVITLFPDMVAQTARYGVTGKAIESGSIQLATWNPRDFTSDRHRTADDRPYGGGPGMVLKVKPLRDAIQAVRSAETDNAKVLYMSPQGKPLSQAIIQQFSARKRLILLAGRYEGIDERLLERDIDEEWSLGDYVISGGELAALVVIDAVSRLLPEVLGDPESAVQDSYTDGLLDYPHYTRPGIIDNQSVPPVLLEGHHAEIQRWRLKQALGRTWQRRPDLMRTRTLTEEEQQLLQAFIVETTATENRD